MASQFLRVLFRILLGLLTRQQVSGLENLPSSPGPSVCRVRATNFE
ncbi:MAG: hypothetical protein WD906_01135 [Anaerolineales bacterium]